MATYQRTQGWTDRPRQDAPSITISTADIRLTNSPATLFSDIAQDKATFPALLGIDASHVRLAGLSTQMHEALSALDADTTLLAALGRRVVERDN